MPHDRRALRQDKADFAQVRHEQRKRDRKDMKASRLIFTLLLASSVAVVQLAAQQTKADQKPIEEVKAKAEAGDAESQVELGRRYDKGEGVMKDHAEAAKWYLKAAEQNYAEAQYSLGVCYLNGEGVATREVEAVKWFRKAAEQNFAVAQYNSGVCYEQGVAKNEREKLFPVFGGEPVEAVKWYRKAAEQNYAPAQYNLGLCYEHGNGVAANRVEAAKWYRKAAEQNDAAAQYNLGMCYERADPGTEDWAEVYKWLSLAARQGHEGAKKFMTVLESKLMTPEQIAQGQKRAREFKPR
jgi:TPR repeat protein